MVNPISRRQALAAAGIVAGGALAGGVSAKALKRSYRRIACEEAFLTPDVRAELARVANNVPSMRSGPIAGFFMDNLLDISERRIAAMTAAGIDLAILSLTAPGVQNFAPDTALDLARRSNDVLAESIRRNPRHYAGLATIPPQLPEAAARELERAVKTLGLKGAIINSNTNEEYLDLPKFLPIFEAAQALDVPIYIHPREPSRSMGDALVIPGFTVGWGYMVETGTNALRLIASGLFDRLPRLKIVLGHLGEGLPLLIDRLDGRYEFERRVVGAGNRIQRKPSEYIRQNFWLTTSGMNTAAPVRMTIEQMGIDRVLFAADYPMEDQAEAVRELESVPMSAAEKRKVFETNAVELFKLT